MPCFPTSKVLNVPVSIAPRLPVSLALQGGGAWGAYTWGVLERLLSRADLDTVRRRVADGCPVLGLRFRGDRASGTRFETLTRELGDGFLKVEFPGNKHSTLTEHRQQEAVDRVLEFFDERLKTA